MEKDYRSLEQKIKNIIIEAANFRNTNARAKIANVARPDDADPTSEKSKLAKQGEIKTKIIDEAEEKKTDDEKPKDKKESKAGSSKAETEFTGGKTEVDTEPKTDDKIDDESAEKSKGDKAAAKANKEIGKKPNPVKEETSMFGTSKNFGLSASLIAAVSEATKMRKEADANLDKVNNIADTLKGMSTTQPGKLPNTDAGGPDMFKSNAPSIVKKEALHPNQRKLDVAPPKGKLTAADFAKLRKEEVDLDEEDKHEYDKHFEKQSKKMQDAINLHLRRGKSYPGAVKAAKFHVKEEVEELDELSKGTMKSYVKKALDPSSEKSVSNLASRGGFEQGISGDDDDSSGHKYDRKSVVRSKGVQRAVNKLTKEEVEELDEVHDTDAKVSAERKAEARKKTVARMAKGLFDKVATDTRKKGLVKKEEVELEELSKATVGSYVKKSAQDLKNLEAGREKGESLPAHIRRNRMQNNRTVGTIRGVDKLTGAAKVPANEEIQFSEEEIARITEIAKGL